MAEAAVAVWSGRDVLRLDRKGLLEGSGLGNNVSFSKLGDK